MLNKSNVLWVRPNRSLPAAFKLFTGQYCSSSPEVKNILLCACEHRTYNFFCWFFSAGSAWMALSHSFVEYIIWGWDNLPRTLLMYYTNFVSSPEGYFHTVICNVPEFSKTVVNHDLHYIAWDKPPRQHPRVLSLRDMGQMIASGSAFGRKFRRNDTVLDKIDKELLMRTNEDGFTPGGWCGGKPECLVVEDVAMIRPSSGAVRLKGLVDRLVAEAKSGKNQCK